MSFKQPRVPEHRPGESPSECIRKIILFLKDFCMESWKETENLKKEIASSDGGETEAPTISQVIDAVYPVGSVYISASDASPSLLFGGEWEQIEGKFLLGAGGSYEAGSTGGEAEHLLTIEEMPSHTHDDKYHTNNTTGTEWVGQSGKGAQITRTTTATGGGLAHNNMPPYLAVYIWKRTA